MAALTDLSDILNRLSGGNSGAPEHNWTYINNRVGGAAASAGIAGREISLWGYEKSPGGSPTTPTTAAIPTNSSAGSLMQINPASGKQKWLLGFTASSGASGTLFLYDRLAHNGGMSATVVGASTTNLPTPALTRNTSGIGNQIFLEIYTIIGATARTATVQYKNENGVTKTSKSVAFGGTGVRESERIIRVPLADGDMGVTVIENVNISASTGTAGNYGVVIAKPITLLSVPVAGSAAARDFVSGLPSMPEIETDACLALSFLSTSTTSPQIFTSLHMIEK